MATVCHREDLVNPLGVIVVIVVVGGHSNPRRSSFGCYLMKTMIHRQTFVARIYCDDGSGTEEYWLNEGLCIVSV